MYFVCDVYAKLRASGVPSVTESIGHAGLKSKESSSEYLHAAWEN